MGNMAGYFVFLNRAETFTDATEVPHCAVQFVFTAACAHLWPEKPTVAPAGT